MTAAAADPAAARIDTELERLGARALVVLSAEGGVEPDLAYFVGAAKLGEALVVRAPGAPPRLAYFTPMERDEAAATGLALLEPERLDLARRARENPEPGAYLAALLEAALEQSGVAPGPIAVAGGWPAGTLVTAAERFASAGWRVVDGSEALRRARKRKRPHELEEARRVAAITAGIFRTIAARLAGTVERDGELWSEGERLTVAKLKRDVALACAAEGLTQPRTNIVAPGEEGGVPHTSGTPERVLRAGESLVVDLYPKGLLFADCTRTFCVGAPPENLLRAHAAVEDALLLAHREARAGARGWEIQEKVCALLGERDYPTPISAPGTLTGYVHNLGHGLGYELHELPSFRAQASEEDGRLEVDDLVTLEPGLYQPGAGGYGVRLEDMAIVTESGVDNLTPLPCALDPRSWRA